MSSSLPSALTVLAGFGGVKNVKAPSERPEPDLPACRDHQVCVGRKDRKQGTCLWLEGRYAGLFLGS
jgi:hypothetical protein